MLRGYTVPLFLTAYTKNSPCCALLSLFKSQMAE